MKITKEWDEVVQKIYELIGIGSLYDLELIIPELLFIEYKESYKEEHNKRLSYKYIQLKASNYCSGPKITSIIKIKFGPEEKIDKEKKEIIIQFKYASKIVVYLIALFEPSVLKINTIDLEERKDTFSNSISTLDSFK